MKVATIFAIIGHLLMMVWGAFSQFLYRNADIDPEILGFVWMFIAFFSGITMIIFLIVFINFYDRLERRL